MFSGIIRLAQKSGGPSLSATLCSTGFSPRFRYAAMARKSESVARETNKVATYESSVHLWADLISPKKLPRRERIDCHRNHEERNLDQRYLRRAVPGD